MRFIEICLSLDLYLNSQGKQAEYHLNFNKLLPISVPKVVEMTYTIYQGLSKRRLCKEYLGRKVDNVPGGLFAPKFCLCSYLSLFP